MPRAARLANLRGRFDAPRAEHARRGCRDGEPGGRAGGDPKSADAPPTASGRSVTRRAATPSRAAGSRRGRRRGGRVIAAAAVADAAPGEAPDATARRVASAMEAALGGAFAKREDPGKSGISSVLPSCLADARGDASADPDSSWAQALGALEGEWAASLNLSRAPDSETKVTRSSPIQSQTQAASPSRYAGVASRDADDAFAASRLRRRRRRAQRPRRRGRT